MVRRQVGVTGATTRQAAGETVTQPTTIKIGTINQRMTTKTGTITDQPETNNAKIAVGGNHDRPNPEKRIVGSLDNSKQATYLLVVT